MRQLPLGTLLMLLCSLFLTMTLGCDDDESKSVSDTDITDTLQDSETSDDTELTDADLGGDDTVDTTPIDYSSHRIEGGGTEGGAIAGLAVVFVLDESTNTPIEDAHVLLVDGEDKLESSTDDEGQCVLTGIEGPIEVHIAADAYGTASVYGLNATYFSVNLKPLVTDAPQVLTLTGEVSGFDSIPDTGANEVKVAIVQHGLAVEVDNRGDFPELSQPDKEGQDLPQNMTFAAAREFNLDIYQAEGALSVLGGILNTQDNSFEITNIGVRTSVNGDPLTENIALDTGFTQESTVELTEPSGELAELNVILRANFGEGGTAAVNIKPSGAAMPHVDFNSGYFAEASADLLMIGKVSEDQEFPNSIRIERDIATQLGSTLSYSLMDLPQATWSERELSIELPAEAVVATLEMEDEQEQPVWNALILDPAQSTLSLPSLPEAWNVNLEPAKLKVTAVGRAGFDPNNGQFWELIDSIETISVVQASP